MLKPAQTFVGRAVELERGAAAFEAIGAPRYLAEAEQALVRLGRRRHRRTRPGAPESGGVESLTQRELEVARLIVDRRTNAQIAAELFLSTKTVEAHISHLFHKLGVSSRVEVARAIERSDLRARASPSGDRQDSAPARRGGRI